MGGQLAGRATASAAGRRLPVRIHDEDSALQQSRRSANRTQRCERCVQPREGGCGTGTGLWGETQEAMARGNRRRPRLQRTTCDVRRATCEVRGARCARCEKERREKREEREALNAPSPRLRVKVNNQPLLCQKCADTSRDLAANLDCTRTRRCSHECRPRTSRLGDDITSTVAAAMLG